MVDESVYGRYFSSHLYTVTCDTVNEEAVFDNEVVAHLLQSVLERFEAKQQLTLLAYLCLPNQIQLLVALGPKGAIDEVVHRIKTDYSREYATLLGNPGRMMLFEQSHHIRELVTPDDFATQLDLLHYRPVELGLVSRPEEWPYSSYELWVERQLYKLGWGWQKPRPMA